MQAVSDFDINNGDVGGRRGGDRGGWSVQSSGYYHARRSTRSVQLAVAIVDIHQVHVLYVDSVVSALHAIADRLVILTNIDSASVCSCRPYIP